MSTCLVEVYSLRLLAWCRPQRLSDSWLKRYIGSEDEEKAKSGEVCHPFEQGDRSSASLDGVLYRRDNECRDRVNYVG